MFFLLIYCSGSGHGHPHRRSVCTPLGGADADLGVMRIINFAHGEFLMVGMYIVYFLVAKQGWDPYVTLLVSVPALFVVGVPSLGSHPADSHPFQHESDHADAGLSLILQNLALVLFRADPLIAQTAYSRITFGLGPAIVRVPQLIAFVGSGLAAVLLYWFLQKTDAGRAIRAASQNREAARVDGIDVRRTYWLAFGLARLPGRRPLRIMVPFYYTSPTVGLWFGQVAFIVVVLAAWELYRRVGRRQIIGLTEAFGAAILPGSLSRVFTFTILSSCCCSGPGIFGGGKK